MTSFEDLTMERLRQSGLRPTRQRRELARLLFSDRVEAVTAENLHAYAAKHGVKVSLATVYGTLHCFCDAGLVREVSIDSRRYFDITPENCQYYYYEDERRLVGVSAAETGFVGMPVPPPGRKVTRVDVVVRLRRN